MNREFLINSWIFHSNNTFLKLKVIGHIEGGHLVFALPNYAHISVDNSNQIIYSI